MDENEADLRARLEGLSTEELRSVVVSTEHTAHAQELARALLLARGEPPEAVPVPPPAAAPPPPPAEPGRVQTAAGFVLLIVCHLVYFAFNRRQEQAVTLIMVGFFQVYYVFPLVVALVATGRTRMAAGASWAAGVTFALSITLCFGNGLSNLGR